MTTEHGIQVAVSRRPEDIECIRHFAANKLHQLFGVLDALRDMSPETEAKFVAEMQQKLTDREMK